MNDTAIVTCFYTNLHGTNYGGRSHKYYQYLMSLASLLKMTNADFFVYCDPSQQEELKKFVEHYVNVKIIPFNLENFYMKELFSKHKNFEEARTSQRCQEIQYLKTYWMNETKDYEWIFWFDIGISYSGLIPNKHMIHVGENLECYNSDLFHNDLLEGMKKFSDDKLLAFCINNNTPSFYRQCLLEYYGCLYQDQIFYHMVAGIFGGRKNTVYKFHEMFYNLAIQVINARKEVHDEECIYNILWHQTPEFFAAEKFETWWHEDNAAGHNPDNPKWVNYIKSLRSFYKILVDLKKLPKSKET